MFWPFNFLMFKPSLKRDDTWHPGLLSDHTPKDLLPPTRKHDRSSLVFKTDLGALKRERWHTESEESTDRTNVNKIIAIALLILILFI